MSRASVASGPAFLPSPETLRAASRLEWHVEWSQGFWLAYVFTISPPQAHILQERLGAKLRGQGKDQRVLRPETPEGLEQVLADLLGDGHAGCTWIEAIRERTTTADGGAWADAWSRLILRANERRELIRGRLEGGVVLVAHPEMKPELRRAGPDLWSIRNFVFALPVGPSVAAEDVGDRRAAYATREQEPSDRAGFADEELQEADLARLPEALSGRAPEHQATTLLRLARRLRESARYQRAEELVRQAVEIYRRLEAEQPGAHLADLAGSLDNLGNRSSELGRREEALGATQEAVDIRRALAEERPDAFMPDLAGSLNNLGIRLSELGRREEALGATQEAVAAYRALAEERPDAFLPDLAMSLNNLGTCLSELGRREEALGATQEAVDAYRALAEERPDAFLPDLATSLNNLGIRLSELGRMEEALRTTQEAVDIRRALAEERPDAFMPDLVRSLGAHGSVCLDAGLYARALEAFGEGVRLILPAATRLPQAFGGLVVRLAHEVRRAAAEGDLPIPPDLARLLDQLPDT